MASNFPFTSAINAGSSIAAGFGRARALRTEAAQLDRARRDERISAKQRADIQRTNLTEALATIDSIRASRGLSADSAGGLNIRRVARERSRTNENAEQLSSRNRQETLKTQAALKRRAAPFAILGGAVQGATSLAVGLLKE